MLPGDVPDRLHHRPGQDGPAVQGGTYGHQGPGPQLRIRRGHLLRIHRRGPLHRAVHRLRRQDSRQLQEDPPGRQGAARLRRRQRVPRDRPGLRQVRDPAVLGVPRHPHHRDLRPPGGGRHTDAPRVRSGPGKEEGRLGQDTARQGVRQHRVRRRLQPLRGLRRGPLRRRDNRPRLPREPAGRGVRRGEDGDCRPGPGGPQQDPQGGLVHHGGPVLPRQVPLGHPPTVH